VRRLRAADAVLLAVLIPLWVAAFALYVKEAVNGRLAWVTVFVSPADSASAYPSVRAFWPGTEAESEGLALGDHLTRIGVADLRGVGPFGFVARAYEQAGADARVALTYERAGQTGAASMSLHPVAYPWRLVPLTATLVATAALVLVRRPGTAIARAFFAMALAYAFHWTFFFGGPRVQTYAWIAAFAASSLVIFPLILRAVMIFPEEVAPPSGRLPWWPWVFAAFGPMALSSVFGIPLPPHIGLRGVFVLNVAFIATLLAVLTRNFRRAGPRGRRQLKWIVLGMYLGTMPVLLTNVVTAVEPSLWWLHELAMIAEAFIPIFILIAIVRFNYFDIDQLITGTVAYTLLSVLFMAAIFTVIPRLAAAMSAAVQLDASVGQMVLSFVAAVGLVPGQRYVRPWVERLFFSERHALKQGVEHLLAELSDVATPTALLTLAGERLDALLRPASCAIYVPEGDACQPAFVRGGMGGTFVWPVLATDGALIRRLRAHSGPMDVEDWSRGHAGPSLSDDERRVLEHLQAGVLLPLKRAGALAGFVWLGRKRSGDVYTATDLALLGAVADKLSGELLRFDEAEVLRQERQMTEALRRYVPEPVAARLAVGREIEGGERDVSVLFVDIRGYTSYSEGQGAGDVFSVVNRYTEAVAAVIRAHGGTVVEFLGDGLMALFGAPEALPQHERAAVQAGRAIIDTMRSLALGGSRPEAPTLSVGVGVASGGAFVGNVRTGDRLVYTAIGDTVNLASRLQGLTRELDAAIAIESLTWTRAGDAAEGFTSRPQVAIRGRIERVDVYILPRAQGA